MKHQQAVYLQEMGITRWQVRNPELFDDPLATKSVDLSSYALLVLSSEDDRSHPLMNNILKAFRFSTDDVYYCSMAEFENHQGDLPEYIWSLLGPINQPFAHKLLTSPSLSEIATNVKEKKSLWNQFCAFN